MAQIAGLKKPVEVSEWTVEEVVAFLEDIGLSQWEHTFRVHGVDGNVLVGLSSADVGRASGEADAKCVR